jgi:hypothetical protein
MRFNKGAKSEKRRALRQEACTHALLTLRQEARTCHAKVGDTFYVSFSVLLYVSLSVWLYVWLYVSASLRHPSSQQQESGCCVYVLQYF